MKTNYSRIGKRALSIVLTLMMILSTMVVGISTVSAAEDKTRVYYYGDSAPQIWAWGEGHNGDYYVGTSDYEHRPTMNKLDGVDKVYYYDLYQSATNIRFNNDTVSDLGNWTTVPKIYKDGKWQDYSATPVGSKAKFAVNGNLSSLNDQWNTFSTANLVSTPYPNMDNVFYKDFTVANDNQYFRLMTEDKTQYGPGNSDIQLVLNTKVQTIAKSDAKAFGFPKGTYRLCVDQSTEAPKIWIETPGEQPTVAPTEAPTEAPTTPVEPATDYYIAGRLNENWNPGSKNRPLTETSTEGVYSYDTGKTVKELSQMWNDKNDSGATYTAEQFFFIHTGKGVGDNITWYGGNGGNESKHSFQTNKGLENALVLQPYTGKDTNTSTLIRFSDTSDTSTDPVTIWLDTRDGMKLYYTAGAPEESGEFTITSDSVNGSVSAKVEGFAINTANAGSTVKLTANPDEKYDFDSWTASYEVVDETGKKSKVDVQISAEGTFVMPNANVTVKAVFTLNKPRFVTGTDALWIDVNPASSTSSATLIKWNNYYGSNHDTSKNPYTFYVPKNVDLSNAVIYNGFSANVTLNGTSIPANGSANVSLSANAEYTTSGGTNKSVKVMQGSTDAMFLYTTSKGDDYPVPTETKLGINEDPSQYPKDSVKADGGVCVTMDNSNSAVFSNDLAISSLKGRGNSSWEAAAKLFGKYAYNIKLSKATGLLGLPKSKSYCLLANNVDEAMLRNALTYGLANSVGLYDSPEFRFVDIYDNGEYLGQYLVTEKVDVASSNKLVKGNSIDDMNEDEGAVFDEKNPVHQNDENNNPIGFATQTNTSEVTISNSYKTKGTYLLEFEIPERYGAEASYFTSNQGQNIVLKSPEFANEAQVKFIRDKFNAMEALVYTDNINLEELSQVMDLDSFARMYLIQELSSNLDSAATSYYITYDCSKGKFVASPVWDYDWAYGQYNNANKAAMDGLANPSPKDPEVWFAKYKAMGDGKTAKNYSLQSKLATSTTFQTVIKKVWKGTDKQNGFYAELMTYSEGNNSQLLQWKSEINSSVAMNETRYGFIKDNNASGWGSENTGANFSEGVQYLINWCNKRGTWLNTEINKYDNYSQLATPTLKVTDADGAAIEGTVNVGSTVKLTAATPESYVTFKFYDGDTLLASNTTGKFTVENLSAGEHNFKVETVYGNSSKASSVVTVTAEGEEIELNASLTVDKDSVITGVQFVLSASANMDAEFEYHEVVGDTDKVIKSQSVATTCPVIKNEVGTYSYYVVAIVGDKMATSSTVTVTVNEPVVGEHDVTVYFKSATSKSYAPSITFNGVTKPMTKDADKVLGKTFSGVSTIAWFKATITVDSSTESTVTFTTAGTRLNASYTNDFGGDEYYLVADDVYAGKNVTNLTGSKEYILNYVHSERHMVNDGTFVDGTLGFTYIGGVFHHIGEYINDGTAERVSIKSATLAQEIAADITSTSELQENLLDVNMDGRINVQDATLIGRYLVYA